jgi:hypothetical protein
MLLLLCTSTIHLQAMDEWDGITIAKGFYSGTGTKTDPYRIFTASQFLYFLQQTKDGNTFEGQYVELCNDIAFKSNEGLVKGGDFYGDFDGNDHTIQVNKYKQEYQDYIWGGWHLFNLYGSMHDVLFVRANYAMSIYTGGILYNCRFEFPSSYPAGYHGDWTILLKGGTIANCVSNSASWRNRLEQGQAGGFISDERNQSSGYCFNCYFPITSYPYSGSAKPNYYGTIESCGTAAGNDWVQNHTEYAYKTWPLTFEPTYPEYQIKEHPQTYNPTVVYPYSDEALYQWCYQERKPIIFEDIKGNATQTKTIEVPADGAILSFDFKAHGYTYTGYNDGTDKPAWIRINSEDIVYVYDEVEGHYSSTVSSGTYEISCTRSDISNICITYPTEILENETSNTLTKQTIMERPGVYFCEVSYGEGCDVMYSDYVDYEKLLTINDVTYVINADSTATVLWVADIAVDITILETVNYNGVNYPVTSISSKAFADCEILASIKCKASDSPSLLGYVTFEGVNSASVTSNATLYVPVGCESAYSVAEGWKDFVNIEGVKITITINQYGSATYCSEYALDFSNVEGLKAYAATGYNKATQVVTLTRLQTAEAGVGLFLKGEPGEYVVPAIGYSNDYSLNLLVGTLESTIVNSTDGEMSNYKFTIADGDNEPMFYPFLDGTTLSAGKAYLQIPTAWLPVTAQKSVSIRFDEGETTDVNELKGEDGKVKTVYDLQGRVVEKPTNGIYIIDGKKVIIK